MSGRGPVVGGLAAIALGACARDSIAPVCPEAAAGDLVITELRGAQTGGDTYGQWVEIFNGSGGDLDLEGLHVVFTRADGGDVSRAIVRRSLPLAAGSYAVIGHADDAMRPVHVDYGMGTDFTSAWYAGGLVELDACGTMVDSFTYTSLPTSGTFELGVSPPDAAANNDTANWCIDTEPNPDTTQLGLPGSPGAANPSCP